MDAAIDPEMAIAEELRRKARNLSAGAIKAFEACMDQSLMGSTTLPHLALHYRQSLEIQAKPPQLKGVRNELKSLEEAAYSLRRLINHLSAEALEEIGLAGEIASRGHFPDLLQAKDRGDLRGLFLKAPQSSMSLWADRLFGVETFANLLGAELENVGSGAKNLWEECRAVSPEDDLHAGILRLFEEKGITDRWLEHVARVVRAWALDQDPIELPSNWGKGSRTRAREAKVKLHTAIDGVSLRIRQLYMQSVTFSRRGRRGWIKR